MAKEKALKEEKIKKETVKKEKVKKEKVKKDSFFKNVRKEMKNVKWPTAKEVFKYSVATIALALFFMGFFMLMDLLLSLIKGVL